MSLLRTEFEQVEHTIENLKETLSKLEKILPFEIDKELTELDQYIDQKENISNYYFELEELFKSYQKLTEDHVNIICAIFDRIIKELMLFNNLAANRISDLRLEWNENDPEAWYQKGKIVFQLFVERKINDFEGVLEIFNHVIDITRDSKNYKELTFWSYSYLGNLYLYRILTGKEALEHTMKHYNQAYRFAKENNIDVEDSFIFDNVEILQQILMNRYPLLILLYNDSGIKIFEYMFQFIEVITEDQRFIPNFTALLSAVDSRMFELFNSGISSSYIVIENRLMVITTIHKESVDEWVKVAMVFSYLHKPDYNVEVDEVLADKINKFNTQLTENAEIKEYITNFDGKHDEEINEKIERLLGRIFGK